MWFDIFSLLALYYYLESTSCIISFKFARNLNNNLSFIQVIIHIHIDIVQSLQESSTYEGDM